MTKDNRLFFMSASSSFSLRRRSSFARLEMSVRLGRAKPRPSSERLELTLPRTLSPPPSAQPARRAARLARSLASRRVSRRRLAVRSPLSYALVPSSIRRPLGKRPVLTSRPPSSSLVLSPTPSRTSSTAPPPTPRPHRPTSPMSPPPRSCSSRCPCVSERAGRSPRPASSTPRSRLSPRRRRCTFPFPPLSSLAPAPCRVGHPGLAVLRRSRTSLPRLYFPLLPKSTPLQHALSAGSVPVSERGESRRRRLSEPTRANRLESSVSVLLVQPQLVQAGAPAESPTSSSSHRVSRPSCRPEPPPPVSHPLVLRHPPASVRQSTSQQGLGQLIKTPSRSASSTLAPPHPAPPHAPPDDHAQRRRRGRQPGPARRPVHERGHRRPRRVERHRQRRLHDHHVRARPRQEGCRRHDQLGPCVLLSPSPLLKGPRASR